LKRLFVILLAIFMAQGLIFDLRASDEECLERDIYGTTKFHNSQTPDEAEALLKEYQEKFELSKKQIINLRNNYLRTALFYAAFDGNAEVVQFFLDNGADVFARNTAGRTVLFYAATPEIAEILVTHSPGLLFAEDLNKNKPSKFLNDYIKRASFKSLQDLTQLERVKEKLDELEESYVYPSTKVPKIIRKTRETLFSFERIGKRAFEFNLMPSRDDRDDVIEEGKTSEARTEILEYLKGRIKISKQEPAQRRQVLFFNVAAQTALQKINGGTLKNHDIEEIVGTMNQQLKVMGGTEYSREEVDTILGDFYKEACYSPVPKLKTQSPQTSEKAKKARKRKGRDTAWNGEQ